MVVLRYVVSNGVVSSDIYSSDFVKISKTWALFLKLSIWGFVINSISCHNFAFFLGKSSGECREIVFKV